MHIVTAKDQRRAMAFVETRAAAADNVSVLGSRPRWSVLENYQETITHDEFAHRVNDVYCTHGFAPDLIEINEKTARILMNRETQKFFRLRFAEKDDGRKSVPRLWRPAKSLPPAKPGRSPARPAPGGSPRRRRASLGSVVACPVWRQSH